MTDVGRFVSPQWRGVYRDLREDGSPRGRAFLLATGLWCLWPFRWVFPEVNNAPLPSPRPRKEA